MTDPHCHLGELPPDGSSLARDRGTCRACGTAGLLVAGGDLCAFCDEVSRAIATPRPGERRPTGARPGGRRRPMIPRVPADAPPSTGKTALRKHLAGARLTQRQAILAKCCDCMGYWRDGRADCRVPACSLYPFMPYREKAPSASADGAVVASEGSKPTGVPAQEETPDAA